MCGRFNVSDTPEMRLLMKSLRVSHLPEPRRNVAPGALGQFVIEQEGERQLLEGYWSLLIEPRPDGKPGYRPNPKFKTFNARSDRIASSPLWRGRIRSKRAVVPVTGYHEWIGKQCYQIQQEGRAIALAGMYDLWQFGDEIVPAFTVITLGAHPRSAQIHDRLPLMLEPKDFDAWLDPDMTQAEAFQDLMQPVLHHAIRAVPVVSPMTLEPSGPELVIAAD